MGEVWRARHTALQTQVAVKFLLAGSAASERAQRRFLTEAQVTANLRTRHAVQVFDFGVTADGRPYLVMELLEGETLDQRIAREGRLPVLATAAILEQAARALDRAHALGIVHRDFKPENVMLVADEESGGELVKVVDFGIAKLVGSLDDALKGALSALATTGCAPDAGEITSVGVGTPYYMAPEQVQDSAQVGPAADVWGVRRGRLRVPDGPAALRRRLDRRAPPARPGGRSAALRVDLRARAPRLRRVVPRRLRARSSRALPRCPYRGRRARARASPSRRRRSRWRAPPPSLPPRLTPPSTSPLAATLDPAPSPPAVVAPAPPPEAPAPALPRTRRPGAPDLGPLGDGPRDPGRGGVDGARYPPRSRWSG